MYQAAGKLGSVSEYAGLGLAAYKSGKLDISREGIVGDDVILFGLSQGDVGKVCISLQRLLTLFLTY